MVKKIDDAAAKRFATSYFGELDVAPESHDLSLVKMTLVFPQGACVDRLPGDLGNGYNAAPPETISLAAALLFIREMDVLSARTLPRLAQCINDAMMMKPKAKDLTPPMVKELLLSIDSGLPGNVRRREATPARSIGTNDVIFNLDRLKVKPHRVRSRVGA